MIAFWRGNHFATIGHLYLSVANIHEDIHPNLALVNCFAVDIPVYTFSISFGNNRCPDVCDRRVFLILNNDWDYMTWKRNTMYRPVSLYEAGCSLCAGLSMRENERKWITRFQVLVSLWLSCSFSHQVNQLNDRWEIWWKISNMEF